jgi:hypothetical protein
MPKPEDHGAGPEENGREPERIDASAGFEKSDVKIAGILVFITALSIFVVVTAILCYGIGKVLNARMNKEDGPASRWAKTVDVRQLGNMPNNPEMQNKIAELTQQFPTPRVQTDDGNQDVADLHAREDLLLQNYSWADPAHTKVRIPIERAMELLAQRGLPVAPAVQTAPLMTGESAPELQAPLTSGFARTAYEREEARTEAIEARQREGNK